MGHCSFCDGSILLSSLSTRQCLSLIAVRLGFGYGQIDFDFDHSLISYDVFHFSSSLSYQTVSLLACRSSCSAPEELSSKGLDILLRSSRGIHYTVSLVSCPIDPNFTNSHITSEAKKYSKHGYFCCFGNMAVIFIDFIQNFVLNLAFN